MAALDWLAAFHALWWEEVRSLYPITSNAAEASACSVQAQGYAVYIHTLFFGMMRASVLRCQTAGQTPAMVVRYQWPLVFSNAPVSSMRLAGARAAAVHQPQHALQHQCRQHSQCTRWATPSYLAVGPRLLLAPGYTPARVQQHASQLVRPASSGRPH